MPAQQVPEFALLLQRAGTKSNQRKGLSPGQKMQRWIRKYRYGARAFSTLEGYASRNRETELASAPEGVERAATVEVLV